MTTSELIQEFESSKIWLNDNCTARDYFERGDGFQWKVDPTVVKLADFYQMIVNAEANDDEAFPESYFDEVFG